MFNEAFWFFYLIGMVGSLTQLVWAITISFTIIGAIVLMIGTIEDDAPVRRVGFRIGIIAICAACLIVIVPTQQSLYAGGAQYAVEAVELDDTLMAFKDIIDAKIADLTPTE